MPIKRKINRPVTAIYIHIPFCQHICDYCDFPKLQYFRLFGEKYLSSLKKEMESYNIPDTIKTIYVGGGTPTALDDDLFLKLLRIIKPYTSQVEEYTFEANPESLSKEKLEIMKEYGVNRISLGVQTTNDEVLRKIGPLTRFLSWLSSTKYTSVWPTTTTSFSRSSRSRLQT